MCLVILPNKTKEAKKNKSGFVYRYKTLTCVHGSKDLCSAFRQAYIWKPGWNKSSCHKIDLAECQHVVERGIHVFKSPCNFARWCNHYESEVLVKVKCYYKDLIAVGHTSDEAYTKVFLEKKEYDRAKKAIIKKLKKL